MFTNNQNISGIEKLFVGIVGLNNYYSCILVLSCIYRTTYIWPSVYRLPEMPPYLSVILRETKDGKELRRDSRFVNAFLKVLMTDLLTCVDPENP